MCMCLREPTWRPRLPSTSGLCHPLFFTTSQPTPGNGIGILIHNSVAYNMLDIITNLQAMACRIRLQQITTICNIYIYIYIHLNENPSLQDLNFLISQLSLPSILVGDMNRKHALWGNAQIDQHGQTFEQLLLSNYIKFLNTRSATHFRVQTESTSAIDLSICSSGILADLYWRTLEHIHGSDHYPIIIDQLSADPVNREPQYIPKRADWKLNGGRNTRNIYQTYYSRCKQLNSQIIWANISKANTLVERRLHTSEC